MTEEEKLLKIRITNIQRFSLQDGPGIRTTVFLKGCSLRCPWCANPENIRYETESWHKSDGTDGIFGRDISLEALYIELLKDRRFYFDGGGVTFSGGEPLLQIEKYVPLLAELKQNEIHLAIETSLFAPQTQVETAANYFDWWYVDMKLLAPEMCRRMLNGDVQQYLDNLAVLADSGIGPVIRIPCAHGITDTAENLNLLVHLIKRFGFEHIEIFGIHDLAGEKYRSINREWTMDISHSDEAVQTVAQFFKEAQVKYSIIKI